MRDAEIERAALSSIPSSCIDPRTLSFPRRNRESSNDLPNRRDLENRRRKRNPDAASCRMRHTSLLGSRSALHASPLLARMSKEGRNPTKNALSCSNTKAAAIEALSRAKHVPKLVVFDLDYCFWPCWCEMYDVRDTAKVFPESMAVLEALQTSQVPVAVASRTPTPDVARSFLKQLGIDASFCSLQLIPARDGYDDVTAQKDVAHFPNIREETGVEYHEMLFFDDEHKNVERVSKLGVTSVLVSPRHGVDRRMLELGLVKYAQKRRNASSG